MKTLAPAIVALSVWLTTAVAAQTPPDNAAVLKAIQKLNQRFDKLEKRMDAMEGGGAASAASPAPAAPSPVKKTAGQYATVKGWLVDVIPAENDQKDAVASFSWDKPEFNFGLHTKLISSHDPFIYRGAAKFYPDQKTRYVFQLIIEPLRDNHGDYFRCKGNIKIGSDVIAEGMVRTGSDLQGNWDRNGELFTSAMYSGGAELEPPPDPSKGYVITFQVSCWLDDQNHANLGDNSFKNWTDNRFSILVKGPDDAAGRAFAGDELYHAGKVRAAR